MTSYPVLLLCLVVVGVLVAAREAAASPWGMQAPSLYHCCCPACRVNGRLCFSCRNAEYYCNCEACSCFPSEQALDVEDQDASFIQMLLRGGGFTSTRMKKAFDRLSAAYEEELT